MSSFLRGTEIVHGGGPREGTDAEQTPTETPTASPQSPPFETDSRATTATGEAKEPVIAARELLYSTVGLSFWGGIDPLTGVVVDRTHPLFGRCVTGTILAIPSGRGSCTGSQVMLELILNGTAPRAVLVRDPPDPILAVGAIVAREMFVGDGDGDGGGVVAEENVPSIVSLSENRFRELGESRSTHVVLRGSTVFHGRTATDAEVAAAGADEESLTTVSVLREPHLSDEELSILRGGEDVTPAQRVAMRVVTRVASICDAPSLIPITKAHIDGCTYVGPGGLRFARTLVRLGGRVSVPTTLNSVSADRRRWQELGVSPALGRPAGDVGDAYVALGASPDSFTCAPYLLGEDHAPSEGEQVAWGESNAVVYANSVLGARTQKYADYLDVCCALVGRVPAAGPHLDEHRRPSVVLDATDVVDQCVVPFLSPGSGDGVDDEDADARGGVDSFFPLLGYVCGNLSEGRVPLILGLENIADFVSTDDLKALSAAFGTSGSVALFHAAGVTPEARDLRGALASRGLALDGDGVRGGGGETIPTVRVTRDDLVGAFRDLDGGGPVGGGGGPDDSSEDGAGDHKKRAIGRGGRVDLVALGNPHLSITECERLAGLCDVATHPSRKKKHPDVSVFATLGRRVHGEAAELGYFSTLEEFGVRLVNDTCWCMLTEPVVPVDPEATIVTNSGKYAHYAPGLVNRRTRFASLGGCVEAARTGLAPPPPKWLGLGGTETGRRHYSSPTSCGGCGFSSPSWTSRSFKSGLTVLGGSQWVKLGVRAVVLRR